MARKPQRFDYVKYVCGKADGSVIQGFGKIVDFDHENNPIVDTPHGKLTIVLGGLKRDRYPNDSIRVVSERYLKEHKINL